MTYNTIRMPYNDPCYAPVGPVLPRYNSHAGQTTRVTSPRAAKSAADGLRAHALSSQKFNTSATLSAAGARGLHTLSRVTLA